MGTSNDLVAKANYITGHYEPLVNRAIETTDEIINAISVGHTDELERLIESRWETIRSIGQATPVVESIINEIQSQDDGSESFVRQQLRGAVDRVREAQKSLLEKQDKCEAVLSEELRRCKDALISINRHRGLQQAYATPRAEQSAVYLDMSP